MKPICPRCKKTPFDEEDVKHIIEDGGPWSGVKRYRCDCPHCEFRFDIIVFSDNERWLALAVNEEIGERMYKTLLWAYRLGATAEILAFATSVNG